MIRQVMISKCFEAGESSDTHRAMEGRGEAVVVTPVVSLKFRF